MNYLAHIYLADITGTSLVGNFLGDFVKGSQVNSALPAHYCEGIFIHRKVDVFTDGHPIVMASRKLISAGRRRFSGIIVDVAFDFFLANHWHDYASIPLADFVNSFYAALSAEFDVLPVNSRQLVSRLIAENWLQNYQTFEGITFALDGIAHRYKKRFNRDNPLLNSAEEILVNHSALLADFRAFFPQLIDYTQSLVSGHAEEDR